MFYLRKRKGYVRTEVLIYPFLCGLAVYLYIKKMNGMAERSLLDERKGFTKSRSHVIMSQS